MSILRKIGIGKFLFVVALLTYSLGSTSTVSDSRWTIAVSLSFLEGKMGVLDDYRGVISQDDYTVVRAANGHLYSAYPVGTPLLIVPLVAVTKLYHQFIEHDDLHAVLADGSKDAVNEAYLASFIASLTVLLFYCVMRLLVSDEISLVLALIFAFCTGTWPTASRALWQNGPAMLMLVLLLYLIVQARRNKPHLIQYAGLLAEFLFLVRPADAYVVVFLTIYVFFAHRRYFVLYLLWGVVIALPYAAYTVSIGQSLIPANYFAYPYSISSDFLSGLLGVLVSPNRGLFLFSPILLFAIVGIIIKTRQRAWTGLDFFVLSCVVGGYLFEGAYDDWWGGWSFGPRLLTDILPYLIYFMIPVVTAIPRLKTVPRMAVLTAFISLAAVSFAIQARGATVQSTWDWNKDLLNLSLTSDTLWDWRNMQILH